MMVINIFSISKTMLPKGVNRYPAVHEYGLSLLRVWIKISLHKPAVWSCSTLSEAINSFCRRNPTQCIWTFIIWKKKKMDCNHKLYQLPVFTSSCVGNCNNCVHDISSFKISSRSFPMKRSKIWFGFRHWKDNNAMYTFLLQNLGFETCITWRYCGWGNPRDSVVFSCFGRVFTMKRKPMKFHKSHFSW